ncbi:MAG TPA: MFS transporter [Rhizomicrobium sp.]|jgi:DHA2 family multidrug resistance protein-like MFS transporter|nr:MFS transporter [Rhizomicrobium sp.]
MNDASAAIAGTVHAHPDGLPLPGRIWAIVTIALGITMAVVDSAIANVALPTIAVDLRTDPAFSIWIVNGYQLAITIALLPLSSAGDILGYRRVYLGGLALFTIASLACAFSRTLPELAAARVVQGFGAAGIMSVNIALVRFIYPQRLLGRGIGINALVVAVSAAVGPTIASGILSLADWPWLFAVNVPLGVLAYLIGARFLPHTPRGRHGFDYVSAALSALAFGMLIASIDMLGHGEPFPWFLGEMAVTGVLAWLLVRRELAAPVPLVPVDLLRIPIFTLSVSTSISSFAAQMLALVSLPFLFQLDMHYTAVETGLFITPWPIAIAIAAPIAGRLSDRYPAGLLGGIGLGIFAAGLLSLAFLPDRPGALDIVWRMALAGIGFGLFQSPNNRAMIASAPRERSGGASGALGTARLLGQTAGASIVALLFARMPQNATVAALLIATGFALVAACVSLARLYEPLAQARSRASNPEADPTMHATLLRQDRDRGDIVPQPAAERQEDDPALNVLK